MSIDINGLNEYILYDGNLEINENIITIEENVLRKKYAILSAVLLVLLTSVISVKAESPVQLALFNPVQLVSEGEAVTGLRLNIYGKNTTLTGIDWGFVHHLTAPSMGAQFGLAAYNESDFTGWQDSFVNLTKGTFTGLQHGAFNSAGAGKGLQAGFINTAASWEGIQLGFVNHVQSMKGIQVGIVNIIKSGGKFPVFPIVNWSL